MSETMRTVFAIDFILSRFKRLLKTNGKSSLVLVSDKRKGNVMALEEEKSADDLWLARV